MDLSGSVSSEAMEALIDLIYYGRAEVDDGDAAGEVAVAAHALKMKAVAEHLFVKTSVVFQLRKREEVMDNKTKKKAAKRSAGPAAAEETPPPKVAKGKKEEVSFGTL